jgi:hypothetical protein
VERKSRHTYLDPLDAVWLTVAHRIGFRVERSASANVYASTDGKGVMTIGAPSTLDPDDCLAQMILHELCHSLIEGAESLGVPDFGLDNESVRDVVREHACLRLQASLTGKHGLRQALAPTTDFRSYYDQLPEDPFADDGDPATAAAQRGAARSRLRPRGRQTSYMVGIRELIHPVQPTRCVVHGASLPHGPVVTESLPEGTLPRGRCAASTLRGDTVTPSPGNPRPTWYSCAASSEAGGPVAPEIIHIPRLDQTFRCPFGGCSSGGMAVQPKGEMSNG